MGLLAFAEATRLTDWYATGHMSLADWPAAKWAARLIFALSVCLVLSIFFFGVLEKLFH
jgi:hypothetical protein